MSFEPHTASLRAVWAWQFLKETKELAPSRRFATSEECLTKIQAEWRDCKTKGMDLGQFVIVEHNTKLGALLLRNAPFRPLAAGDHQAADLCKKQPEVASAFEPKYMRELVGVVDGGSSAAAETAKV